MRLVINLKLLLALGKKMRPLYLLCLIPVLSIHSSYSETPTSEDTMLIAQAQLSCFAQWNEICEDKKIITAPTNYRICKHDITPQNTEGDTEFAITEESDNNIVIYFRASGNGDRVKQKGAAVNLTISLYGVRSNESCNDGSQLQQAAIKQAVIATPELITPINSTPALTNKAPIKPHACACSQWLRWMDVSSCLKAGKNRDGSACDTLETTLQCVETQTLCKKIQNEECPQIASLNQSESLKRIFIENSPYCSQQQ